MIKKVARRAISPHEVEYFSEWKDYYKQEMLTELMKEVDLVIPQHLLFAEYLWKEKDTFPFVIQFYEITMIIMNEEEPK